MKTLGKWIALIAIFISAGKLFMDAFGPEYEQWKEKYPPEPEELDPEDEESSDKNVVRADDLFKPDEQQFIQDGETKAPY